MTSNNSSLYPAQDLGFRIALNTSVGIISILSIVGSALIIASFVLFKDLQSASRFLLLNLSIATLIVPLSDLVGIGFSLSYGGLHNATNISQNDTACKFQAFVSLYAVDCSILWTIAFLAYLYISLSCCQPTKLGNGIIITICMIICWGVPLPIAVVFLAKDYFAYTPDFSPGYCTIFSENRSELYRVIVGYDMFLYIAYTVLPILCVVFLCHSQYRHHKMKSRTNYNRLEEHMTKIRNAERKLLFVPITFMLLFIWGLIGQIAVFYLPENLSEQYRHSKISAFIVFMAGIGQSAQGFVNAVFFCLLTPAVRARFIMKCYNCCCYNSYCYSCCYKCNRSRLSVLSTQQTTSTTSRLRSNTPVNYNTNDSDDGVVITPKSLTNVSNSTLYESQCSDN